MIGYYGPQPLWRAPFAQRDDERPRKQILPLPVRQDDGMLGGIPPLMLQASTAGAPQQYSGGGQPGNADGTPAITSAMLYGLVSPGGSGVDRGFGSVADPFAGYSGVKSLSDAQLMDARSIGQYAGWAPNVLGMIGKGAGLIDINPEAAARDRMSIIDQALNGGMFGNAFGQFGGLFGGPFGGYGGTGAVSGAANGQFGPDVGGWL